MQLLYRNAKQMKKIVEAKYSNLRFDDQVLMAKEMGFECSEPNVSSQLGGDAEGSLMCVEIAHARWSVFGVSLAECHPRDK